MLTSLGATPATQEETVYRWGKQAVRTRFAPCALARMLRPERVVVLLTGQARASHWQPFQESMRTLGARAPEDFAIPDEELQFWETFKVIQKALRGSTKVLLDITGGYRYLPFVYYAVLAYLSAFRDTTLAGVYYGFRDGRIADLTRVVAVTEGYHAVRSFKEAGNIRPALAVLRRQVDDGGRAPGELRACIEALERVEPPLATGLPLEAGLRLRVAANRLQRLNDGSGDQALEGFGGLLAALRGELEAYAVPEPAAKHLPLSEAELERELRLISWYLDKGRVETALLLMREWVINRCLLAEGKVAEWLNRKSARVPTEARLKALAMARAGAVAADTGLRELWRDLCDARNPLAHGGFAREEINSHDTAAKAAAFLEILRKRQADAAFWALPTRTVSRLLVSGLGTSPGSLYTALCRTRPDRLVVFTSPEAGAALPEILATAGMPILPTVKVELVKPFTGFAEGRARVRELQAELENAETVVCNQTGGTTLMGHLVEQMARQGERLGAVVSRVAVVDERSSEEQRRNPYMLGDQFDLDDLDEETEK